MRRLVGFILLAIIVVAIYVSRQAAEETAGAPAASLIPLLAEDSTSGFDRATEAGAISFPQDLGAHESFQTEWWYYTGNLETSGGRPFGFQLTFFRRALTPEGSRTNHDGNYPQSAWRTNQVYLAHFTVSDIADNEFYANEQVGRGAAGLAGAQAAPYRVWLNNWSAEVEGQGTVRLRAETGEVALDLVLTQTLPPILHGNEGLSPKGPEPGNASYYYSFVQQKAVGTISVQGEEHSVSGLAWKDHEYSTSALSKGVVGWDWFSVQLSDGSALMFFEIRRADGSLESTSQGTFVQSDGTVRQLEYGDWQLSVLDTWTSEKSGAEYPAGWQITIPKIELELTGRPMMSDQELNVSTTYWEGAVSFEGMLEGKPASARGYVELTGYAEAIAGRA